MIKESQTAGSSPLTRGKPVWQAHRGRRTGLIPAHAGKTHRTSTCPSRARAHPRSRGENEGAEDISIIEMGSSPLTRGKRCARHCRRLCSGLIPTHAGKTSGSRCSTAASRAHPHSRGENTSPAGATGLSQGSSPLTRGKPSPCLPVHALVGLIPTHAGKTPAQPSDHRRCRAHPHSRGEYFMDAGIATHVWGSSPLTRGKLCDVADG